MPRNSSGDYTLPAGNPVVTLTTIQSTWANTTLEDLADAMTDSLSRNGDGGMLAPLPLDNGTAALPSLTFTSDPNTGVYRVGADDLGFSTGGTLRFDISTTALTSTLPLLAPSGAVGTPSLSFSADTDLGWYRVGANLMGLGATQLQVPDGAVGTPIYGFTSDTDTGIYRVGADSIGIAAGGILGLDVFVTTGTTQAGVGDGTVAKPSLCFNSDTNTGIYRAGADILGIVVGGAFAARFYGGSVPQSAFVDGTAATPAIGFDNDSNTGMYLAAADNVAFTTGGTYRAGFSTTIFNTRLVVQGPDGAVAAPAYSFENDTDTGIYRGGANDFRVAAGGTTIVLITASGLTMNGLPIFNGDGSAAAPSYSFSSDTNTGIYRPGADLIAVSCGGTVGFSVQNVGAGVFGLQLGATSSDSHVLFTTTAATASTGAAGAPPAQVVGYISININGTNRKIPYYAT